MPSTRVVILAAGKGTRMKSDVPKPLIPVSGEPMVTRLVRSVKESGVDSRPILVVAPWSEALFRATLGETVDYAVQEEQLGTGHALLAAQAAAGSAELLVVLNGDHPFVSAPSIQNLVRMAKEYQNSVVLLTAIVPGFSGDYAAFAKWGRVLRDADGSVIAIREAKDATPEELLVSEVNPNMYALPAAWTWERLMTIKNENASGEYYLTDLVAAAMEDGKTIVTSPAGPRDVIGINTPEDLARAESLFAQE